MAIWGYAKLTKDSPENRGFFGEGVKVVVEVVVDPQRQIDHFDDLGDDLRAAAKSCEKVADVAVVLFDGDGQVFAGEELVIRDEAVSGRRGAPSRLARKLAEPDAAERKRNAAWRSD